MSRSETQNPTRNFGTPFHHFVKGLAPIVYSNELGGCRRIQLTPFLRNNKTNVSYIKETITLISSYHSSYVLSLKESTNVSKTSLLHIMRCSIAHEIGNPTLTPIQSLMCG